MRFDLTVNEFTRDIWARRPLEVFGEQFWRPYVHVRDAARAIVLVLGAPEGAVAGRVFNVGHSDENYTKRQLVEHIVERIGHGDVRYVHRDEDPRDYRVSFERIAAELGFVPRMRVPDGIGEVVEGARGAALRRPVLRPRTRTSRPRERRARRPAVRPAHRRRQRAAVDDVLRSGWLTMGPRTAEFEAAFAARLGVPHAVAVVERHGGAAPRLPRAPASGPATR